MADKSHLSRKKIRTRYHDTCEPPLPCLWDTYDSPTMIETQNPSSSYSAEPHKHHIAQQPYSGRLSLSSEIWKHSDSSFHILHNRILVRQSALARSETNKRELCRTWLLNQCSHFAPYEGILKLLSAQPLLHKPHKDCNFQIKDVNFDHTCSKGDVFKDAQIARKHLCRTKHYCLEDQRIRHQIQKTSHLWPWFYSCKPGHWRLSYRFDNLGLQWSSASLHRPHVSEFCMPPGQSALDLSFPKFADVSSLSIRFSVCCIVNTTCKLLHTFQHSLACTKGICIVWKFVGLFGLTAEIWKHSTLIDI